MIFQITQILLAGLFSHPDLSNFLFPLQLFKLRAVKEGENIEMTGWSESGLLVVTPRPSNNIPTQSRGWSLSSTVSPAWAALKAGHSAT